MAVTTEKSGSAAAIRPLRIEIPQEEIDELRRRLQATRWPENETVADTSQGVQLATIQELARYWAATEYDFGRLEVRRTSPPGGRGPTRCPSGPTSSSRTSSPWSILTVFAVIVGFMPNFLGHPDNYIEGEPAPDPVADPLEWYFLPFYAMAPRHHLRRPLDQLQARRRAGHVRLHRGDAALALARHQPGALGALPADVHGLGLALVVAFVLRLCAAAGAAVRHHQPAADALLVRLLPGDPADPRRRRESRCRRPRRSRPTSGSTTAPARRRWSAPRSASRPNERGREHVHAEDHDPRRPCGARLGSAAPRSRRRRAGRARGGAGHRLPLLLRGSLRPLRPVAAPARAAGLHRGLRRLPRPQVSWPSASSPSMAARR